MKAVFDTNILIDHLNGIAEARKEIKRYSRILISSITWMEVLVGASEEEEPLVRAFLSQFEQIHVTGEIAEKAVSIRRGSKLRLPDAIIKATAEIENALLVSRNTKDFPEDDPGIVVPYHL
ncbi:MAG TPA: VapC toxin family PIN domain ribonuclease [Gammaproteobacteria bacterium]|nr:VapC toxin family PIN domain ribonuclease [Gammaproteobacteria bacterium]